MGLAEALREVVRWGWFDGWHRRRRVALLASFPALLGPRVHQQIRALDGGPLRHRACVLASWRRYALLVGLCLWAARVRACRVLLRCYALGSALWASRCLRRLPLAVIGCDALVSTACFAREQGAGQASRGLAAASAFRCHSSTGAGPWVPGGWTPGHFDFRCGYFISRKSTQAARGSPSTALAVAR